MTEKTPLNELIKEFEEMKNSCNNTYTKIVYDVFINKSKEKLPKERQNLIDANQDGLISGFGAGFIWENEAEQYVKDKFGI